MRRFQNIVCPSRAAWLALGAALVCALISQLSASTATGSQDATAAEVAEKARDSFAEGYSSSSFARPTTTSSSRLFERAALSQQLEQHELTNGQCPVFASSSATSARLHDHHDRVQVDPQSGQRSFSAKIVGIFSCLEQAGNGGGSGGGGGLHGEPATAGNDLTLDFRLAKPVIDLAVRAVNEKYVGSMHFNVTYRTASDICKHQQAAGHAADEYYVNGANYFVGPGCSESLASVGQLASYWNVPICSTGYLPEMVTTRFSPLTLMQLSLSVQSIGEMLLEMFQLYKWRHLVIVTDEKHPLHSLIRDGLLEFFHTMYRTPGAAGAAGAAGQPSSLNNNNQRGGGGNFQQPSQHSGAGSGGAPISNVRNYQVAGGAQMSSSSSSSSSSSQSMNANRAHQNQHQHQSQQQQQQQGGQSATPYYINITSRNFAYSSEKPVDYEQVMLDAAGMSRIMLLLARSPIVGKLLEAAHAQDMSRGQFVFIAHELFETQAFEGSPAATTTTATNAAPATIPIQISHSSSGQQVEQHLEPISSRKYTLGDRIELQSPQSGANEQLMREIFSPLMTISLRIPTTTAFDTFKAEVVGLSEREFNYRLQPSSLKSLYSLGLAAFIYDCVMLYADRVNFILNQTQFSRIDGRTIFELAAGKTFVGGLTGDLTINRAGQRVIDFTLKDFSAKTLNLEPIAYFHAIERRLQFLPGRVAHWTLRNQSTPRSDPRCRANDTVICRSSFLDDLDLDAATAYGAGAGGHHLGASSSDRVVLGVWLVVIIILSVAITSSTIGWLVYRRFRIESELLNLWWSIKYEDIIFEDENEIVCDGKRSMSSLAISNESLNEGASVAAAAAAALQKTTGVGAGQSGRTSPAATSSIAGGCGLGGELTPSGLDCAPHQLGVAAGNRTGGSQNLSQNGNAAGGGGGGGMSAAYSSSSLSVGGAGGGGQQPAAIVGSSPAPSNALLGPAGLNQLQAAISHQHHHQDSATAATSGGHQQQQHGGRAGQTGGKDAQRRFVMSTSSGGASKLIPLLANKSTGSGGATSGRGAQKWAGGSGSGKQSSGGGAHKGGGGTCGSASGTQQSASLGPNAKDPSITSQNKNVKLRLGTVLNGRDQSHTTKVGLYKASRVAAKHLNVKNLTINRQLLIELRQVRDLTHENLIKFIGLCPEEPNVAIVSELCTRGNLQDLLQNETIRLDWPFRFSIINDIVDGLIHLHSSPVQYHGRLKSSNCVIDNRFVVKLTDFGLPTLLAAVEMDDGEVNPRLLLWTAPEHLRTKYPLLSGSQKGDIYSLAIIFQEIITRCGPFECEPILCGSSEVGVPADLLAQQQQFQFQQQQQQLNAPLIRTTEYATSGSRLNVAGGPRGGGGVGGVNARRGGGGGGGGVGGAGGMRASNMNLSQHQLQLQQFQLQQQMQLLQPIVVQHKQRLEPEEIVNLVRMGLSPPFRPYFRPDVVGGAGVAGQQHGGVGTNVQQQQQSGSGQAPDFSVSDLVAIVQSCWQESPATRPTIASVKQQIKKLRRGCHLDGANLMDNLLQRMERYTDNLESLVEQKTAELMEEKKRSEELLYEMLPRFVVDQLKYGHSVTPEAYDAVTISFSDIKDFTSIAAQSSPIEVVNLLNQLYTEFDDCIARYDVYKVETIGDAYMVVSGLPIRNGDHHAKEIAEMSLAMLELIRNFDVAHLPHVKLELRIGIHSGPCASGVVGTRMFRYCLFGDTVNTASRMESHGEPMKIHISEDSADILRRFKTFIIEPRGQVDIKGKGLMNTYWLTGKTSENNILSYLGGSLAGR